MHHNKRMSSPKNPQAKARLHPRNRNRERYDLDALKTVMPSLERYVKINKHGIESVDFSDPVVVRLLNTAILKHYYQIEHWEFSKHNLCPPIPGRADYIHYLADLLATSNAGQTLIADTVTCLDIGTGASCIYPILGVTEYNWNFIATDIDTQSIASANQIIGANPMLNGKIDCRLQPKTNSIFNGILNPNELVDVVMCNPPFHSSVEEAQKSSLRKVRNLKGRKTTKPTLNFAGNANELVSEGGEYGFIKRMIIESESFAKNCLWFTTLISKASNLKGIDRLLNGTSAKQVEVIPMGTSNKSSRIIAWTYLSAAEHRKWRAKEWQKP